MGREAERRDNHCGTLQAGAIPLPGPGRGHKPGTRGGCNHPAREGGHGEMSPAFTWICCCSRLILCCCWMSCCCCLAIWQEGDSGAQQQQWQRRAGPGRAVARHELPNTGKMETRGLRRVPRAVGRVGRGWLSCS